MSKPRPKRCPYCRRREPWVQLSTGGYYEEEWLYFCGACGANGPLAATRAEALRLWNLRKASSWRPGLRWEPCLWCGSMDSRLWDYEGWFRICRDCEATGPTTHAKRDATAAWNRGRLHRRAKGKDADRKDSQ